MPSHSLRNDELLCSFATFLVKISDICMWQFMLNICMASNKNDMHVSKDIKAIVSSVPQVKVNYMICTTSLFLMGFYFLKTIEVAPHVSRALHVS